MIITFICDVLGQENNGTTIATMNVIRSMEEKGHTVRVVCPDEDKRGLPNYFIVPRINFGPFDNYVKKNGVVLAKADLDILYEAIKGADVVHCNLCGSLSAKSVELAHAMGIPVTASFHAQAENFTNHVGLMRFEPANWGMYEIIYKRLFSKVDAIHYPSQFIRDVFEKAVHFASNGYVISNGVRGDFVHIEMAKPEELKDKIVILYTARYSKEKAPKRLIDAVHYSRHRDDIQLILAGEGPLKNKIIEWTKNWKNKPILGFHSHEEMIKILNYSDIYCHPSVVDLEAISALEAISCGLTPVLSNSKKAAIRYFALTPNNLFRWSSSKDLAAKIDYWIEHPEEKKQNSEQYLGFAKQFDFTLAMNEMERMFKETAENYKKKGSSK